MSRLTQNTTNLDALIEKANALPDKLDTSDADATADDIVSPKTAYVNGVKVTGTNPYEKTATDTHIANALTEIVNKGVTVPSGADVSDLATLIAEIEAGGGKYAYGAFKPASDVDNIDITHNLGVVPDYAICAVPLGNASNIIQVIGVVPGVNEYYPSSCFLFYRTSSSKVNDSTENVDITIDTPTLWYQCAYAANEQTIRFGIHESFSMGIKMGAYTAFPYKWIVWKGTE